MPTSKPISLLHRVRCFAVLIMVGLLLPIPSVSAQTEGAGMEAFAKKMSAKDRRIPDQTAIKAPTITHSMNANLLQDPSFESSYGSLNYWDQYSTNFDTPLCILADCGNGSGTAGPRTGNVWAWFGGANFSDPKVTSPEIGDVWQSITFPSCRATLQFYLWIGAAAPGSDANDYFGVAIEGNTVFTANATQKSSYPTYRLVSVDVSAYANGASHMVEFYSVTSGQLVTFNLDDVSIFSPGCSISGDTGVAGVSLKYVDNTLKSATSASTGSYSLLASEGWTGTVTPSHPCFTFSPANLPYTNLLANRTNQNYTPTFNIASGCADITVSVGGTDRGRFGILPSGSTRVSFSGVNSGSVKIASVNSLSLIGAERVIYNINGVNTSFSEMMGLPDNQLDQIYWLPWYNNVDLDTQLRIGNVSNSTATVHVFIGTTEVTPVDGISLLQGGSKRLSYGGVNKGPVKIVSDQNIVAAERVIYNINGVNTSFSEMMALPNSQLDTTYWLPWYNNVDLDSQLRIGNVSDSTATVHVFIGTTEVTPVDGIPLLKGASRRLSYGGVNKGPVKIVSDFPIVAAERVIYKINGVNTSFSELMALPNSQLDTTYWLPWYNNVDLDSQLRIANVSDTNQTATVNMFIGAKEMTSGCTPLNSPFTLPAGASIRVTCTGINRGPVKIVSDQNIVAAERVIYKINGVNTSFSELMALSDSQLDTTYWMPWYNNVDLDTQLRFGVP